MSLPDHSVLRILTAGVLSILALAALILAACGADDSLEIVHGRVVDVQTGSIMEVDSFALVDGEGEEWSFVVEGPLEFTPSHMREHMLTGDEVLVSYRRAGGLMIAVSVADYP